MSASSWDEAVPPTAAPPAEGARWNAATRVAFRFAFSYLVLYTFPFPFDLIPFTSSIALKYEAMWRAIVTAAAKRFFDLEVTIFTNGSGDTTYDYLKVLCMVAVAAVATLLWSILDRRRPSYRQLYEWLRVYVRFGLGAAMIFYGAVKIIPSQFPGPTLDRLIQPFGDASPMGLLWTFMNASAAYNIFSGAGEMLGGLLLTFRRTTLLGALVTIAVVANIVALNFCYDVPVKLFSVHLLAMAAFLVLPDARRLLQTFLLHEPSPLARAQWLRIGGIVLRTALVGFIVVTSLQHARQNRAERTRRSPLRGIWNVDTLVVDGVNRPPLVTDEARWRRVIFDHPGFVAFQAMSGSRTRYLLTLDEKKGTMLLKRYDVPGWAATLVFRRPLPNTIVVDGPMDGRTYHAVLRKADDASFLLTTRGFHWINESPFNR